MQNYSVIPTPAVYVGTGSLKRLAPLVKHKRVGSVAVIADQAVVSNGYLARIAEQLGSTPHDLFVIPAGEPTVRSVNDAVAFARELENPLVLGVGGGSALDTAKQVAAVLAGSESLEHYLLAANRFRGRAPLAAIPTTAGTGAEATRVCVVSDAEGRKLWTWGAELLPDAVFLDPAVTLSVPAHVTTMTALDALVHAIEACTSARRNAIASAAGLQAVRLIREQLPRVTVQPGDLVARQHLQEAAYLAGLAFDQSALGIAHNVGHALGTLYHIPHGAAVTIALDATLAWNVEGAPEVYAPVAQVFGVSVEALAGAVRDFIREVGFEQVVVQLPRFEVDASALSDTMNAPENRSLLELNARTPSEEERTVLAERVAARVRELLAPL